MNQHDHGANPDPSLAGSALPPLTRRTFITAGAILSVFAALAIRTASAGSDATSPASPQPCKVTPLASPVASPAAAVKPAVVVTMTNELRFEPDDFKVRVGDTIEWRNESHVPHTATCDPAQNPVNKSHPEYVKLPDGAKPWGSPLLQPAEVFQLTVTTPGEYLYICVPHVLSGMRAKFTVTC